LPITLHVERHLATEDAGRPIALVIVPKRSDTCESSVHVSKPGAGAIGDPDYLSVIFNLALKASSP
jgi:hypothetical protein